MAFIPLENYDVAILGGGITGALFALNLKKKPLFYRF
jgi:2-polyprenyl-6-methoxyphenol hydroxylase-like FAD-dependent oxidoreductase|tara:strand:- start:2350 stop:2460 length:111 start_codon:yes stop_codon:yes gene_type:complete